MTTANASRTVWDVRPGEAIQLIGTEPGQNVSVELVHKSGKLARLVVSAPRAVKVQKTEPGK